MTTTRRPPAPLDPLTRALPRASEEHGYRVLRSVPFAVRMGHRPLQLDLHLPEPVGAPVPIIVFVHGGGWRAGFRDSMGAVLDELHPHPFERVTRAGFVVATIDYRLSGEAKFPAQLDDVLSAVAWLRARAHEFGGDAEKLVLWGESSGGHLVALAGLAAEPSVRGVICWYSPLDLPTLHEGAHPEAVADPLAADSREAGLLGAPIAEAGALALAASPLRQVHAHAPRFHLVHGTDDRFVPTSQSLRFAEALRAVGAPVECELIEGADHFWRGAPDPAAILADAIEFAHRVTV